MRRLKAFLLYRIIREEVNEQLVAAGCYGLGFLCATEAAQTWCFSITTVVNLNVIVSTLQVRFQVNFIEGL